MVGSSLLSLARPSPAATLANGGDDPGSNWLAALPAATNQQASVVGDQD